MNQQKRYNDYLISLGGFNINFEDAYMLSSHVRLPVYCNNRIMPSYPTTRDFVVDVLVDIVRRHFPDAEVIAGVATAGISIGSLVADRLKLIFVYVRSDPKQYGLHQQIEGPVKPGQKVVIVEDLLFAAAACLSVYNALQQAGCDVKGIAALFTYDLPCAKDFASQRNLPVYTITTFLSLVEDAYQQSYITLEQKNALIDWHADFEGWSNEFKRRKNLE